MDPSTALPAPRFAAWSRRSERLLRLLADGRLAVVLLAIAAGWNVLAAALPDGPALLRTPLYALLLGAIVLSGLAAFAVRLPAAWREWRSPGAVSGGAEALTAEIAAGPDADPARYAAVLRRAGYRLNVAPGRRIQIHGTRRGWSRIAALGTHVAVVLLLVGVAVGSAFGSETIFSLLPGDQALLDAPRAGFTDALRLDAFDAAFGAEGRPQKLDAHITFLREGNAVEQSTLQVNAPGSFGGYLVHGWTYGPAARLRVTTLGGQPLADGPLALDRTSGGLPAGSIELPTAGVTLEATLADAGANQLSVAVVDGRGLADVARLAPGQVVRIGPLLVRVDGFTSYVTFMSRRDPGMGVMFAGGALLTVALAAAFWLPRRRLSLRQTDAGLQLVLRGDRFDRPEGELRRLRLLLHGAP
jgi:cytochrome c biogenesis protein ResB